MTEIKTATASQIAESATTAETENAAGNKTLALLEHIMSTSVKNFTGFAGAAIITFLGMFIGPRWALLKTYGEPLEYRSGSVMEAAGTSAVGGLVAVIFLWAIYFISKTIIDIIRRK